MKTFLKRLGLVLFLLLALIAWVFLPWVGALALAVLLALWLGLTRRGGQARSVAGVGISTLPQRLGSSAVIVVGIAGVVGVLVALLAMAEGYSETLRKSGGPDTAIVLRGASAAEVSSVLSRDDITQIGQAAGVARSDKGEPLVSAETVVAANLPVKGGAKDEEGSVQFRGVGDEAFLVRPQVRLIEGRRFQPGLRELIVGKGAARQFNGLTVGKEIRLGNQTWTVTGVFATGDAMESELWADATVLADAFRRGSSRNSVTVRLTGADAFTAFKDSLAANPQLKVDATTTLAFFAKQSEGMTKVLRWIGTVVGAIMAVGAIFGALNTMFAAVATRAREIATLRAIGFPGVPVVVAVMLETMLLAALGGLVGGAVAYLLFNGHAASTMAAGSVGKLSFELRVSGQLLWEGLKWALAIGFIGGLFPAVRAASVPVTTALREL
ncbi:putative ABC transport system permease protein [Roseateles sp. YR242]|uniref:ABC transporter permease n=1 Tax=Roseateles sp. YR242 TaxID=1855305 RepID=UPI0008B0A64F|nr:ABC transporter permease [Roseateles sp. YR242]SEL46250.1 putative ABC transport system permease protein [Roseateles sp. YR242]